MKALILAAGLGTRLHPITKNTPKALAKIKNITLLEILITRFKKFGIEDVMINIHHFADQVVEFVKENNQFGINIQFSDERGELLDTGGGIKKAQWFFNDGNPFLVHNVDVISSIDINDFLNFHQNSGSLVSLAVRNRSTSRYFLFDGNDVLSGWRNISTCQEIISKPSPIFHQFAFSGIHIISPEIFGLISKTGKFSIVEEYLRLSENHIISAYKHDHTYWMDLGKVENLIQAEKILDKLG